MKKMLLFWGILLCGLPGYAQFTRTYTGAIAATDPTIPGDRLLRDATVAVCGGTKAYPGVSGSAINGVRYDTYTVANTSTTATNCVTITLAPTCTETTLLFVSVYTNSFVPTNLATNYKSDMGSSPLNSSTLSMGITLAASEVITIVVSATSAATTCSAYSLTVAAPTALPTKASLAAEATLAAYPNPVADVLHIEAAKAGSYTLYNTTGQAVREIKGSEVSLRDLPSGIYMLQQAETKVATRIVKL